jgi:hypothetical protein
MLNGANMTQINLLMYIGNRREVELTVCKVGIPWSSVRLATRGICRAFERPHHALNKFAYALRLEYRILFLRSSVSSL